MKSNIVRFFITAIAYGTVGLVSIGAATFVATQFVLPTLAQEDGQKDAQAASPEVLPAASSETPSEGTAVAEPSEAAAPVELQELEASAEIPAVDTPPTVGEVAPQEIPDETSSAQDSTLTIENLKEFLRPFSYEPGGRRDPFQPFIQAEKKDEVEFGQEEKVGALTSLERFDLDQIELLGIIWEVTNPKAMMRDPTGRVHIVSKNTKIGRNNGYIAVIREGELVIVESFDDGGEISYKPRIMKIR